MSQFSPEVQGALDHLLEKFAVGKVLDLLLENRVVEAEALRLARLQTTTDANVAESLGLVLLTLAETAQGYKNLRHLVREVIDARRRDGVSKERANLN